MQIALRFYGGLNELVRGRAAQPDGPTCCRFDAGVVEKALQPEAEIHLELSAPTSVKDAVEGRGVPHTEVAMLLIDGEPTGWDTILKGGERVAAYPFGAAFLDENVTRLLQPASPSPVRFLADEPVGQLAKYLRLCGFDVEYLLLRPPEGEIVGLAKTQQRVVLTTDHKLLMNREMVWGKLLFSRAPDEQVREVLDRYGREGAEPFSRCMECNTALEAADLEQVNEQAPDGVRARRPEPSNYRYCSTCDKLYWEGTHTERMRVFLSGWGLA